MQGSSVLEEVKVSDYATKQSEQPAKVAFKEPADNVVEEPKLNLVEEQTQKIA